MYRSILPFLLLLLTPFWCDAQHYLPQNKIWAMGRYVGLDFNGSNGPVVIPTNMDGQNNEGCASVSDADGNLLFYSNGYRAWTATGSIMPHGDGINGFGSIAATATQGTLIVPDIKGDFFYLFTLIQQSLMKCKLYCNVVNMSLNNGLGDIDTTFYLTGIPIEDSLSEKMIAIPGCHNNIWVVTHGANDSIFKAFEITNTGLNLSPVVSTVSNLSPYPPDNFFSVMKASPDWNHIAVCRAPGLVYCRFNRETGIASDPVMLELSTMAYGAAFSPDGSKLYAKASAALPDTLYQYNLSGPLPVRTALGTVGDGWQDLKLGPDGKIYTGSGRGVVSGYSRYAARINYPDSPGLACGFQDSVTSLYFVNPAYTVSGLSIGLPNEVVMPVMEGSDSSAIVLDTTLCDMPPTGLTLHASPGFQAHAWSTGSTEDSITVTQPGTYSVRYSLGDCNTITQLFFIRGNVAPVSILYNAPVLSTGTTYPAYQWYKDGLLLPGEIHQTCTATSNGWYSVKVTGPGGCTDSAAYQVTGGTGIMSRFTLQKNIHIYPNPATDRVWVESPVPVRLSLYNIAGKKLLEEREQHAMNISHIAGGLYFIYITDKNNTLIKVEKLAVQRRAE